MKKIIITATWLTLSAVFTAPAYALLDYSNTTNNFDSGDDNIYSTYQNIYVSGSNEISTEPGSGVYLNTNVSATDGEWSLSAASSFFAPSTSLNYQDSINSESIFTSSGAHLNFNMFVTPTYDYWSAPIFDLIPVVMEYDATVKTDGNSLVNLTVRDESYIDEQGNYVEVITTLTEEEWSAASAWATVEVTEWIEDTESGEWNSNNLYLNTLESNSDSDTLTYRHAAPTLEIDLFESFTIDMQVDTYEIGVTSPFSGVSGQASIDNLKFYIDPTWEHAELFEVNYAYVDWPESVSPVPEPSTLFLFSAGLGFLAYRRKKVVTA